MDVGAQGGIVNQWHPYSHLMEIDAIEPNEEACAKQKAKAPSNVHWFPVGFAKVSGEKILFLLKAPTGSSLYPVNVPVLSRFTGSDYYELAKEVKIKCLSLPDFLSQYSRPVPQLIKLDTQGSELDILSALGAPQWGSVLAVETEVEFLELYKGQPLFQDVHQFMMTKGFELFDIRTHRCYRAKEDKEQYYLKNHLKHRRGTSVHSAQLVAGDAFYMRPPENEDLYHSRQRLAQYILIALIYHYFDVAFVAIENAASRGLLNKDEAENWTREVAGLSPKPHISQRSDTVRVILRSIGRRLGLPHEEYDAFWVKRSWPDQ